MNKLIMFMMAVQMTVSLETAAQPALASPVPLKVGDRVPDAFWTAERKFYRDGKVYAGNLMAMKGKPLVLDFWATWCAPCVAMMPMLDSLRLEFSGRLNILSVTSQKAEVVGAFAEKYHAARATDLVGADLDGVADGKKNAKLGFGGVVSGNGITALFPAASLPNFVWIDASGSVRAVTAGNGVDSGGLLAFLSGAGNVPGSRILRPRVYLDRFSPMLGRNSGDTSLVIAHSYLTAYQPGIGLGNAVMRYGKGMRITVRNYSIANLFRLAYSGEGVKLEPRKFRYEVKDRMELYSFGMKGDTLVDWLRRGHGFCYELLLPFDDVPRARKYMQEDLKRYFPQYVAKVVYADMDCLALVRTGSTFAFADGKEPVFSYDAFSLKVSGLSMDLLLGRLALLYLGNLRMEVLNESGYHGTVDMQLNGDLGKLEVLNAELARYGLLLKVVRRKRPNLVITDAAAKSSFFVH